MLIMKWFVTPLCWAIALAGVSANAVTLANRVGDADLNDELQMADAVLVQSAVYGITPPTGISPLALAGGDSNLGVDDILLVAQIASNATPAAIQPLFPVLNVSAPAPPVYASETTPNPVIVFAVASAFPAAQWVDGLEFVSFVSSPTLSTLASPSTQVAAGQIGITLIPFNPGPGDDAFDLGAGIDILDSGGTFAFAAGSGTFVTVTPPACGDGVLQAGESCDEGAANGNGSCCSALCAIATAGSVCRTSAGGCDQAETCDGVSTACPADSPAALGTVCRIETGDCDVQEVCDGSSFTCPVNSFAPATSACNDCLQGAGRCHRCDGGGTCQDFIYFPSRIFTPILNTLQNGQTCTTCHNAGCCPSGGGNWTTYETLLSTGNHRPVVRPYDAPNSLLYQKINGFDVPPSFGVPMPYFGVERPESQQQDIFDWITQGGTNCGNAKRDGICTGGTRNLLYCDNLTFLCSGGVCTFNEPCDDGNANNCDTCSSNCRSVTGCGDGVRCGVEACDDGNLAGGDGCNATCTGP